MSSKSSVRPLKVLVVEDDPDIAQATVALLTQDGHEAETVTEARQALRLCRERSFDAALVDIMLPGVDGLTLASTLRRHWPAMVLVATTGLTELPDAEEAGLERVLVKPYGADELTACLAELMAKHDGALGKGDGDVRDEVR